MAKPDAQYLTTISREMGLHPKSLHQLRRDRLRRCDLEERPPTVHDWPKPAQFLPDGKELYDPAKFKAWYEKEVAPHWSAKGQTA